jgi:hypothetical protein
MSKHAGEARVDASGEVHYNLLLLLSRSSSNSDMMHGGDQVLVHTAAMRAEGYVGHLQRCTTVHNGSDMHTHKHKNMSTP